MIFVDQASGSVDLIPLLERAGLPVVPGHLEWCDVEFAGRGIKGTPVMIGIEVKRLSELTGDYDRLAGHQIPKMNLHYDFRFLVFEGEWKQDRSGLLTRRSRRGERVSRHGLADATALQKKLLTLEMCAGVHVHHVPADSRKGSWSPEMVRYLTALYRWWTDEDFDKHKSHIVNYQPHGVIPLTKVQQAIAAWPHLSTKRAKAVSSRFVNPDGRPSVRVASNAPAEEWAQIEVLDDEGRVRKIGMKTATQIVSFLNGE